jgi:hypothetical protein
MVLEAGKYKSMVPVSGQSLHDSSSSSRSWKGKSGPNLLENNLYSKTSIMKTIKE